MTLDSRLFGRWQTSEGRVTIEDDGWSFSHTDGPYAISQDGMILERGRDTFYHRILGIPGPNLSGMWRLEIENDGVLMSEEWTFSDLLTFTTVWIEGGKLTDIYYGTYSITGSNLTTSEKRALITLANGRDIAMHVPYGRDENGTYEFVGNDRFSLSLQGRDPKDYIRIP